METRDDKTKEKLITAAMAYLDEEADMEKITVRRLAKRAGVAVGVLNYHFGSKDNLINAAIEMMVSKMASELLQPDTPGLTDPIDIIRNMMKRTSTFAAQYPNRAKAMITADLLHGQLQAPTVLIPLLKAAFPGTDDMKLSLMALQIVLPIQVAAIRSETFCNYCQVNILDEKQRDRVIDLIIDNIVAAAVKENP